MPQQRKHMAKSRKIRKSTERPVRQNSTWIILKVVAITALALFLLPIVLVTLIEPTCAGLIFGWLGSDD